MSRSARMAAIGTLATALVLGLLGGCYEPDFGPASPAPFRCGDGKCPDGYRCADLGVEALCVPDGADDPPVALGPINLDYGPPQPFWTSAGLTIVWQPRGLKRVNAATYDGQKLTILAWKGFAALGAIGFSARYHAKADRVVVAWEDRAQDATRLSVATVAPDGEAEPVVLLQDERPPPLAGFGFSRPGLAFDADDKIVVAYTYGNPPDALGDNVYCELLSLDGARSDACRPPATHTAGAFAIDAMPLANDKLVAVAWLDDRLHLSARSQQGFLPRLDLNLGRLAGGDVDNEQLVLLVRTLAEDGDGAHIWQLMRVDPSGTPKGVELTGAGARLPAVALDAERRRAVVCLPTTDNKLELRGFALPELSPVATVTVDRLSRAAIVDCQLAISPTDGQIGVSWREAVSEAFATIVVMP